MPSYKSSDLSEGLFQGKATLAKFYWSTFDYNGQVKPPATVLCVDVVPEDDTEPFTQRWSAGKGWKPTGDGKDLVAEKGKKVEALSAQSGAGMLIRSLFKPINDVDTGLDESIVENDISVFNGTKVDLVRQKRERRPDDKAAANVAAAFGKKGEDKPKEEAKDTSILLVGEVIEPGPAFSGGKGASKSKSAPAKGKDKEEDSDADEVSPALKKRATKVISKVLADHGEAMTLVALGKKVFASLKGDDDQQAIAKLAADEAFLGNDMAPWKFDGDTITAE